MPKKRRKRFRIRVFDPTGSSLPYEFSQLGNNLKDAVARGMRGSELLIDAFPEPRVKRRKK